MIDIIEIEMTNKKKQEEEEEEEDIYISLYIIRLL